MKNTFEVLVFASSEIDQARREARPAKTVCELKTDSLSEAFAFMNKKLKNNTVKLYKNELLKLCSDDLKAAVDNQLDAFDEDLNKRNIEELNRLGKKLELDV